VSQIGGRLTLALASNCIYHNELTPCVLCV